MASSQPGPVPFDSTIPAALQTLADWATPYAKAIVVLIGLTFAFQVYPTTLQEPGPGWAADNRGSPPQQPVQNGSYSLHPILLLIVAGYLTNILKLPSISETALYLANFSRLLGAPPSGSRSGEETNPPPSPAAVLGAWTTLLGKWGAYIKVALVMAITISFPLSRQLPLPLQTWFYLLIFALVSTAGFLAPAPRFRGPLRFAYLEYGPPLLRVYTLVSRWWFRAVLLLYFTPFALSSTFFPLSYILAPALSLFLASLAVSAYVHIYRTYTAAVAEVTARAASTVSEASIAASHAHVLRGTARDSEKELQQILATARRDAAQVQSVRMTDFFDTAATAWASMQRVVEGVRRAKDRADEVLDRAVELEDLEPPDEDDGGRRTQTEERVRLLKEEAESAVKETSDLVARLEAAQAVVESSKRAGDQDKSGRQKVLAHARDAATEAKTAREVLAGLDEGLYKVDEITAAVKGQAEKAQSLAIEGEMALARSELDEAITGVELAKGEQRKIADMAERVSKILFDLLQKL
ncbi:hypothetical protein GQX73_g6841 [Xylaria multiplex]|uniref:Uncharacterized protein n=1 Tax=Xylaria multiplex TaxID=323545 RepID=A0A7C8MMQ1_9PEZI|nr:hypothetical protein GQX73_g6841 [Xylaria multiplex]